MALLQSRSGFSPRAAALPGHLRGQAVGLLGPRRPGLKREERVPGEPMRDVTEYCANRRRACTFRPVRRSASRWPGRPRSGSGPRFPVALRAGPRSWACSGAERGPGGAGSDRNYTLCGAERGQTPRPPKSERTSLKCFKTCDAARLFHQQRAIACRQAFDRVLADLHGVVVHQQLVHADAHIQ